MADDRPRPADPEPADGLEGGPPPVLHDVAPDQGARPPQAGLAVDGHCALRLFANLQELLEDLVGRGRSVSEEQLLERDNLKLELTIIK